MRSTRIIIFTLVATIAVAAIPASGLSATSQKTKLRCSLQLFAQGAPNPSGIQFGIPTCSRPFGTGLHYSSYTVTPTGPGQGTVAGTFKNAYDRGTARGTVAMTFTATSPADITYTGTLKYTRGTGAFRRLKGTGTITCTTTDGGAHKACTVRSTLTGV